MIGLADVWFKKFGFSRNPFNIKPAAFSYELFGSNVDGVISGIEEGKILFVEAPLGYGKTTLLKGIIHRYGGKKKVIYAHAVPSERLDVKELLKRSSLANFITGSLPSGMILVVDESQNIVPENSAEIMEFYRSGNLRAVVFFGTRYPKESFAADLASMMNGNVVSLSRPTPEQAISLVRSRIGSLPLLSNEAIIAAYMKAQGSPRRLLQLCEDACRSAAEGGKLAVSGEVVSRQRRVRATVKIKAARKKAVRSPKAVNNRKIRSKEKSSKSKSSRKPSLKSSAKQSSQASASYTTSPTESTEGSYWGEFMGMQK